MDEYSDPTPIATAKQFKTALLSLKDKGGLSQRDLMLLRAHFHAAKQTISTFQLAKEVGYASFGAVNIRYGKLARRVADSLRYTPTPDSKGDFHWWRTLSYGNDGTPQTDDGHYEWIMRPELVIALKEWNWDCVSTALFINGVFDTVLTPILVAQAAQGGGESFLQPHSGSVVAMLSARPPTPDSPVPLYISTTENLSKICYTAEIVRWEDKRHLSEERRQSVLRYLETFQPEECDLFRGTELGAGKAVNLITIRNLHPLATLPPTSMLTKKSDGLPLKERARSGGWSEVYQRTDLEVFAIATAETEESSTLKLTEEIQRARDLAPDALQQRLATAPRIPERVQIVSIGYRRNADVIVAVLIRANGICERCGKNAPFMRKSDGTPFLEVHHRTPLADGGEDTTENALALCPNCHRELHHG